MLIHEFAQHPGVPAKTILYCEDIGLMAQPTRISNHYRRYRHPGVERLCLIASTRSLASRWLMFSICWLPGTLASHPAMVCPQRLNTG